MIIPLFLQRLPNRDIVLCSATFMIGFGVVGLSYSLPLIRLGCRKLSKNTFIGFFIVLYLIALIAVLYAFGSNLRLVSFAERTEFRLESRNIPTTAVVTYALSYLAWVLNPMLMCIGLFRRKAFLFLVGAVGQLLLYCIAATRAWILTVLYVPMIFILIKKPSRSFGLAAIWSVCGLFAVLILVGFCFPLLADIPIFLVVFRMFVNNGFMTSVYAQFFSENPITYGSHIKGIDLVAHYPYDLPLPFVVGGFLGNEANSANAHVWADGIASLGLWGIIAVSFLLGFVFLLLDSAAYRHDTPLVSVAIAVQSVVLANLGLSSAFFGGGIGFLVILLVLTPAGLTKTPERRTKVNS